MPAIPLRRKQDERPSFFLIDFVPTQPLSNEESTIERERVYTKGARALEVAMSARGPADSPNFWENVKALLVVSKSTFYPRFLANRVPDVKYNVWPIWPSYQETWIKPPTIGVGMPAPKGKASFEEVVAAFSTGGRSALSSNLLKLAEKAAERLEARKDEDIDAWAKRLGEDLGKFKD